MSKAQRIEAVMFFDEQGEVCRQMFYAEFEALLDGLANMPAFADRQVPAAYLVIDGRLRIQAVVCFYLDFDELGAPDAGWNLPLQQLAERAGGGPDLGGGPIRLACRRQCPVAWQQMHLWDPDPEPGSGPLTRLRDAVRHNGLGILVDGPPVADTQTRGARSDEPSREAVQRLAMRLTQRYRQKAAQLLRRQREQLATLSREHSVELASLKAQADQRLRCQQSEIRALRNALRQQQALNQTLRQQLAQPGVPEQPVPAPADARLPRSSAQLAQRLQAAEQRGGQQMLEELASHGVVFVVYQPGAGHLPLPVSDIAAYLHSPLAYTASRCGVDEAHYRRWLEHYRRPRCMARLGEGGRCQGAVERVETPEAFTPGVSDCCARHGAGGGLRRVC